MAAPASANPFKVGTLVVGYPVDKAGCSSYPTFGKVVKITPTGKYRIERVPKEQYEHPQNYVDQHGSFHAVRPVKDSKAGPWQSWLVRLEESWVDGSMHLTGASTTGRYIGNAYNWDLYDENHTYGNVGDNGD